MIGFLRFIGICNAAIWLGGTFFCVLEAGSGLFSPGMEALLGARNASHFPYLSGALAEIVQARCYQFQTVCAVIAWGHALAEWLYLGRPARRVSFSLLACLLALVLAGGLWLQPRLGQLHTAHYRAAQPAERDAAARSWRAWHTVSDLVNFLVIGGLVVYIWRTVNPADTPRFVSSVKFRG